MLNNSVQRVQSIALVTAISLLMGCTARSEEQRACDARIERARESLNGLQGSSESDASDGGAVITAAERAQIRAQVQALASVEKCAT